jgi:hypothetical protein
MNFHHRTCYPVLRMSTHGRLAGQFQNSRIPEMTPRTP